MSKADLTKNMLMTICVENNFSIDIGNLFKEVADKSGASEILSIMQKIDEHDCFTKILAEKYIKGEATIKDVNSAFLVDFLLAKCVNSCDIIKEIIIDNGGFTKFEAERYVKNEATHKELLSAIWQDRLFFEQKNENPE